MKLYKFKSLRNFDHVIDILLNERLHCAVYKDLNDPFEGIFWTTFGPALVRPSVVIPKTRRMSTVEEVPLNPDCKNICSLSASKSDVRLWSYYADNHKGVAIEIDFSGKEDFISKVSYSLDLPEGSTTLLGGSSTRDILSCKTKHWEYEQEYRIIQAEKYFLIPGMIIAIYLGPRVPENHAQLLRKCCPGGLSVFNTRLDMKKIVVEAVS